MLRGEHMSARGTLLVPEGWTPRRGSVVAILAAKDVPAIPGRWFVFERAPGGWWAQPRDDTARAWAQRNPHAVTSGCIEVPGRRLVPFGHAPRPPATSGARR